MTYLNNPDKKEKSPRVPMQYIGISQSNFAASFSEVSSNLGDYHMSVLNHAQQTEKIILGAKENYLNFSKKRALHLLDEERMLENPLESDKQAHSPFLVCEEYKSLENDTVTETDSVTEVKHLHDTKDVLVGNTVITQENEQLITQEESAIEGKNVVQGAPLSDDTTKEKETPIPDEASNADETAPVEENVVIKTTEQEENVVNETLEKEENVVNETPEQEEKPEENVVREEGNMFIYEVEPSLGMPDEASIEYNFYGEILDENEEASDHDYSHQPDKDIHLKEDGEDYLQNKKILGEEAGKTKKTKEVSSEENDNVMNSGGEDDDMELSLELPEGAPIEHDLYCDKLDEIEEINTKSSHNTEYKHNIHDDNKIDDIVPNKKETGKKKKGFSKLKKLFKNNKK